MRTGLLGIACLFLMGCGVTSSPGTGSVAALAPTSVSGVAATGAPIVRALVTLKDAAGKSSTTTSASDGSYHLATTGLVPPFLIQVQSSPGNLFSVSADALTSTTINTNVYTDLVARSWYAAQGQSIDAAFANPVALPAPNPASVQIVSGVVLRTVLAWINRTGIDGSQFNLISTPFVADGTGFDSVLHDSATNLATGKLTVSDGSTAQTSTITYNPAASMFAINSSSSGPRGSSVSFLSTVVPAQATIQAALDGITSTVATLASTINSRGSLLADSDLLPLLAADALNDGWDRSTYAALLAGAFRPPAGVTATYGFSLRRITSLDLVSGRAEAIFGVTLSATIGGSPFLSRVGDPPEQKFAFEKVGSSWLLSGDQRIAEVSVDQSLSLTAGLLGGFTPVSSPSGVVADAQAAQGSIAGVTVTGGSIWNNTVLPKQLGSISVFLVGTPGNSTPLPLDDFSIFTSPSTNLVPAGTPFTFTVTPVSGAATSYVVQSPAMTNETIAITSPATTSLADISLSQPLQVSWTAPTTFPAASTSVSITASSATVGSGCASVLGSAVVRGNVTTTTITPSSVTCSAPIVRMQISVFVTGANGESASASLNLD